MTTTQATRWRDTTSDGRQIVRVGRYAYTWNGPDLAVGDRVVVPGNWLFPEAREAVVTDLGTDYQGHLVPLMGATPTRAVARAGDPSTSHAAAASLDEDTIRASQRAVLSWLRTHGPSTDEDLVLHYDGPRQSPSGLRTRRRELVAGGLVQDTGARRRTASGRSAIVWEAVA